MLLIHLESLLSKSLDRRGGRERERETDRVRLRLCERMEMIDDGS